MVLPFAQVGMPGAPELIVVVFMFLLFLAVPVLLILLLVKLLRNSQDDQRVQELEKELAELRGRLEERDRQREGDQ